MRVHLGGHLSWYDPQKRHWLEVPLSEPTALAELVRQLGLPLEEIAVVAVNGRAASLEDARVSDGDRVELYPPLGGGNGYSFDLPESHALRVSEAKDQLSGRQPISTDL